MKVKIISSNRYTKLEEQINEFIKNVLVKDIKFIMDTYENDFMAMIMYEEEYYYPECPPIEI